MSIQQIRERAYSLSTNQDGRADSYPWGHFYNVATSFRWGPR